MSALIFVFGFFLFSYCIWYLFNKWGFLKGDREKYREYEEMIKRKYQSKK